MYALLKKDERVKLYLVYTVLFCVTASIVFLPFLIRGKSLVWSLDGLTQHYNSFVYVGTWIRTIVTTLIEKHEFIVPMWEFGLGYGEDAIITLAYYVIGDPLSIVSAFTPVQYAQTVYCMLIIFRFYLSGISFSLYSRKMGCSKFGTICGAIAYAFCTFAMYATIRHMFFGNALVYLPLLLLGVEKILRKESPVLYISMVFVAAISNYYFFYMLTLIIIIYVICRYCSLEEKSVSGFFKICFSYAGYAIIGVLMAAIIFLPIIVAFLGTSRISSEYVFDTFCSLSYYKKLIGALVVPKSPGNWTYIGMTPVCLLCLWALFTNKGKDNWLKWILCIMAGMLVLPVAGHVFNGFGYVCNRWTFAYAFFVAFTLAKYIEDLFELSKYKKVSVVVISIVYCALFFYFGGSKSKGDIAVYLLLVVAALFICFVPMVEKIVKGYFLQYTTRIAKGILVAFIVCGIFSQAYSLYVESDYVSEFHAKGTANDKMSTNDAVYELIDNNDFYRVDWNYWEYFKAIDANSASRNSYIIRGISTTTEFWSIISQYLVEYLQDNSAYNRQNYCFAGLQSRSLLLPFVSAEYFLGVGNGEKKASVEVPYGYEYVGKAKNWRKKAVSLYQSEYALPFGYTCDKYMTEDEYDLLAVEERQQAMLYGAVIGEEYEERLAELETVKPIYTDEKLEYKVECDEGVVLEDNSFIVDERNAKITISYNCPAERELYLKLSGLEYIGSATSIDMKAKQGKRIASATHYTERNQYGHGRTEYLLNMFYANKERTKMVLTFSEKGIYKFDELSVIAQPMDILDKTIPSMTEDVMENCKFSTNQINGTISLDESKLLCFSLPYSKGWSVLVDGEEAELLKTNVMFSGVMLPKGEHSIELNYCTPYIKEGLLLSIIGFMSYIGVIILLRKSKKKGKNNYEM